MVSEAVFNKTKNLIQEFEEKLKLQRYAQNFIRNYLSSVKRFLSLALNK